MKAVLVISSRDNVATALEQLEPERRLQRGQPAAPGPLRMKQW